jgi:hypothetical protein
MRSFTVGIPSDLCLPSGLVIQTRLTGLALAGGKPENGLKKGLQIYEAERVSAISYKKAHAGRGSESKWEIPIESETHKNSKNG